MANIVYWEKQSPQSKLCALHCLNSFLQGPYISNSELAEISKMLDKKESELLNASGTRLDNGHILGYRNDSDGGNFNVTVLVEAFRRRNLRCDYCLLSNLNLNMFQRDDNVGFVCNLNEHWFSIRKLMTDRWFMLDSLRPGPQEMEYGELYSYISNVLETNKGIVFLVYPDSLGSKLSEPNPKKFPKLESHQFFLTLDQIKDMNARGEDYDEEKNFLYRAGQSVRKPTEWPTTGGVRLDQCAAPKIQVNSVAEEEEYKEADSRTVAVKLGGTTRITKRFSPGSAIGEVFAWVEKHVTTPDVVLYTLLQTAPNRRFIKYINGCIEVVQNDENPKDITGVSLMDAGFESQEMFILRCT
ncbi:hypothetical protein BgAZ_304400 [Babesia gibsoni]|uniref:ubiquitinyl hydrolase 1 n=1 Tax=Babesia gibsoni TaxID=33632 RepID=A0AAD8PDZ9_BABGI|nr:hypothetical protein BgAZ_304400 [Babesia gibsoni]